MPDAERDLTAQLDAARITGHVRHDALTCAAGYRKFVRGCFDYPSQTSRYTAPPAAGGETPS
ncbi:hypothetical protein GCM10010341_51910 [Streptomyces noursei]|nr:hypothetical protein GCM10010341_51910 [Streptomyces noursei]